MVASPRPKAQCWFTIIFTAMIVKLLLCAPCISPRAHDNKKIGWILNNTNNSNVLYLGTKSSSTQCEDSCFDLNYLCDKSENDAFRPDGAEFSFDSANCKISTNADANDNTPYIALTSPLNQSTYSIETTFVLHWDQWNSGAAGAGIFWKGHIFADDALLDYFLGINHETVLLVPLTETETGYDNNTNYEVLHKAKNFHANPITSEPTLNPSAYPTEEPSFNPSMVSTRGSTASPILNSSLASSSDTYYYEITETTAVRHKETHKGRVDVFLIVTLSVIGLTSCIILIIFYYFYKLWRSRVQNEAQMKAAMPMKDNAPPTIVPLELCEAGEGPEERRGDNVTSEGPSGLIANDINHNITKGEGRVENIADDEFVVKGDDEDDGNTVNTANSASGRK